MKIGSLCCGIGGIDLGFIQQGFPENYNFPDHLKKSVCYKQIGNSVSVPVINRIAERIKETLERN